MLKNIFSIRTLLRNRLFTGNLAFTLAEVLITLAIIGVVAALTLPALVNDMKDREIVTRLKKTYSILSQAATMVQVHSPASEWNLVDGSVEGTKSFYELFKPYLKVTKDCGCGSYAPTGCWSKGITKTIGGTTANCAIKDTIGCYACAVRLVDGTNLVFDVWGSNNTSSAGNWGSFWVDVNGDKKPNVLGRDVFLFDIKPDKGIIVPRGIGTDFSSCNTKNTNYMGGADCTAKILQEGKIDY